MSVNGPLNETASSNAFDSTLKDVSFKSKHNPFVRPKCPSQEYFNVTFHESNVENNYGFGTDSSLNLSEKKSKLFLPKEATHASDFFDSFHNKTNKGLIEDNLDKARKSVGDESIEFSQSMIVKSNPFHKNNDDNGGQFKVNFDQTKNSILDETLSLKNVFSRQTVTDSEDFQVTFSEVANQASTQEKLTQELIEAASKSNPFKKSAEMIEKNPFEVDFDGSTSSDDSEEPFDNTSLFRNGSCDEKMFSVTYNVTTSQKNILNSSNKIQKNNDSVTKPAEKEKSIIEEMNDNKEEETIREEMPVMFTGTKSTTNDNLSINSNKHQNKTGHSESYLDQSSFNDDNLKYWMSDHSDEEIITPAVPAVMTNTSITTNTSFKKVQPPTQNVIRKQATLPNIWVEKFNDIVASACQEVDLKKEEIKPIKQNKNQKIHSTHQNLKRLKPQKLSKPAPFITKSLYKYLIGKLEPKFGILSVIEAEKLVILISDTVKIVNRRRNYQKKLVTDLKRKLAMAGVVETTIDFYEFIIKFLPHQFRLKVIPCFQPVTNTIFPPKEMSNAFEKIL